LEIWQSNLSTQPSYLQNEETQEVFAERNFPVRGIFASARTARANDWLLAMKELRYFQAD
jgi:hypothetical protein